MDNGIASIGVVWRAFVELSVVVVSSSVVVLVPFPPRFASNPHLVCQPVPYAMLSSSSCTSDGSRGMVLGGRVWVNWWGRVVEVGRCGLQRKGGW